MSIKDQIIAVLITTIASSHSSIGGSGLYLEYIPDFTCQNSSFTSLGVTNKNETNKCPCEPDSFSTSFRSSTIATDFNLFCKSWIPRTITSAMLIIGIVANIITGPLADKFGCKNIGIFMMSASILSGFLTNFADSWLVYSILRMSQFFFISGGYVIGMALTHMLNISEKFKTRLLVAFLWMWSFGFVISAGLAYYFRGWRSFQLALTALSVFGLLGLWMMKTGSNVGFSENIESEGSDLGLEESEPSIIVKLKKVNNFKTDFEEASNVFDLPFHKKCELIKVLSLLFTMGLVLFMFILDDREIGINFYVYKAVAALIDIPFTFSLAPLIEKYSHKFCLKNGFFICIITNLTVILLKIYDLDEHYTAIMLLLNFVGRSVVCMIWNLGYVLMAGLMPSKVRASCLGFAVATAYIGAAVAPQILVTKSMFSSFPEIICGFVVVCDFVFIWSLPEP